MLRWLLLFVLACVAPALATDWQVVSPGGARFSVEMPAPPQHEVKTSSTMVGDIKRYKYASALNGAEYEVQYMDLPGIVTMFKSPKSILENAKKDYLKNVNGTVIAESDVDISGHKGRKVDFRLQSGEVGQMVMVSVGKRLYFVHQVKAPAPDAARFLDSFRILAKS